MTLRLLHTSDWHLGATLGPASRLPEQARFLAWLLARLRDDAVDVLIIAGDVFQLAQPSSEAQRLYYRFLAEAGRSTALRQVVVVGGNHDSASRLDAPREVLDVLNVHVVGGLSGDDEDRCLCPVRGPDGEVQLVVLAVPFVHEFKLGVRLFGQPPEVLRASFVDAFTAFYRRLADLAAARWPGLPLVATGHLTAEGTRAGEYGTEIHQVGTIAGLPGSVFDPRCDYVALGHIHRMFPIAGSAAWYSGSPVAMAFPEAQGRRYVLRIDLDPAAPAGRRATVHPLEVPIWRDLITVRGDLSDVLQTLREVGSAREFPPLIHVDLEVDSGVGTAEQQVIDALADRPDAYRPQVIKIRQHVRSLHDDGPATPVHRLADLRPEDVLRRMHVALRGGPPPEAVLQAFRALLSGNR